MTRLVAEFKLRWRTRGMTSVQRENVRYGLPPNFKLPYPCPQNEHEDGMNWVAVNGVMSGRAGW